MPHTIRLFMWGYQLHFQVSVKHAAERLFKALHPEFEVEVFLLGIAREKDPTIHPVCLQPEDCGFSPSDFARVREDAEHYRAVDPDRDVICSAEWHQRSYERRIEARALRNAVMSVLNGWRNENEGKYYFAGFSPVGKYDVGVVLRAHCNATEQPYRLPKVHAEEQYGAPYSLVDAAAHEFLADCQRSLLTPSPEHVDEYRGRKADELLREAGDRLMETPVWAGSNPDFMYGLFGACNYISELTYESQGSVGGMLIAKVGHKNIEPTLLLRSSFSLGEHRAVRKLLQVASAGDFLLCDGSNIVGFGKQTGVYDQSDADLFEVRFTRHYHWELLHAGHSMMRVSYGTPRLPRAALNADKLASDLERIFSGVESANIQRLVQLALSACDQGHGALLVISANAECEAARLGKQSTLVEPVVLTERIIKAVTAIDGAVLLAPDGKCFAIGVILDGLATPEGDASRGARYNSSVRYVADKTNCAAIIVSEDGVAEWIPSLRPQISRKVLAQKESEARALLSGTDIDEDKARAVINWSRGHRFYLPAAMCDAVNELKKRFDSKMKAEGAPIIIDSEFAPSAEMTDEYLTN
jgi:hypothetical protein